MRTSPRWKHSTTLTYLLTFDCYGTRLPGDPRGWVDRTRGDHRGGYREPSAALESHARESMLHDPYLLDRGRAQLVLASMREVCMFRDWELIAAHVRARNDGRAKVALALFRPRKRFTRRYATSPRAKEQLWQSTCGIAAPRVGDPRSDERGYIVVTRRW